MANTEAVLINYAGNFRKVVFKSGDNLIGLTRAGKGIYTATNILTVEEVAKDVKMGEIVNLLDPEWVVADWSILKDPTTNPTYINFKEGE
jgi:hypothetical protein